MGTVKSTTKEQAIPIPQPSKNLHDQVLFRKQPLCNHSQLIPLTLLMPCSRIDHPTHTVTDVSLYWMAPLHYSVIQEDYGIAVGLPDLSHRESVPFMSPLPPYLGKSKSSGEFKFLKAPVTQLRPRRACLRLN